MLLSLTLVSGVVSLLIMLPAAKHLRSFQDGEQTTATLHTSGSCMLGQCQVEFRADGRRVVADLPAGSGGGKHEVGTRTTVRYDAADPREAVREDDLWGGGAAVLAVLSGGLSLLLLLMSAMGLVQTLRQRRADAS
ncbi:DUF3592 domain-containing protein (plasmid) [Streptomyces sp. CA-294286]|uniref:DUF3592 domain-containing protein n=1 Tax=Streptomyces sp. CA-294286 TaxID=3240070 RepID=UPI003D91C4B9